MIREHLNTLTQAGLLAGLVQTTAINSAAAASVIEVGDTTQGTTLSIDGNGMPIHFIENATITAPLIDIENAATINIASRFVVDVDVFLLNNFEANQEITLTEAADWSHTGQDTGFRLTAPSIKIDNLQELAQELKDAIGPVTAFDLAQLAASVDTPGIQITGINMEPAVFEIGKSFFTNDGLNIQGTVSGYTPVPSPTASLLISAGLLALTQRRR